MKWKAVNRTLSMSEVGIYLYRLSNFPKKVNEQRFGPMVDLQSSRNSFVFTLSVQSHTLYGVCVYMRELVQV